MAEAECPTCGRPTRSPHDPCGYCEREAEAAEKKHAAEAGEAEKRLGI